MLVEISSGHPLPTTAMRASVASQIPPTRQSTVSWCGALSKARPARVQDPTAPAHRPPAVCTAGNRIGSRRPPRVHIRLSVHSRQWKTAREVIIPKPGKDEYGLAKSYRVISFLNCLGKIVEEVAARMLSAHCEAAGRLHPGQYGCRMRRLVADAVSVAIAQTQEAWSRQCISAAFLMDVAAAFASVTRGCLLRKMSAMDIDQCLSVGLVAS